MREQLGFDLGAVPVRPVADHGPSARPGHAPATFARPPVQQGLLDHGPIFAAQFSGAPRADEGTS